MKAAKQIVLSYSKVMAVILNSKQCMGGGAGHDKDDIFYILSLVEERKFNFQSAEEELQRTLEMYIAV